MVEFLPSIHDTLGLIPGTTKIKQNTSPGFMVHMLNSFSLLTLTQGKVEISRFERDEASLPGLSLLHRDEEMGLDALVVWELTFFRGPHLCLYIWAIQNDLKMTLKLQGKMN